LSRDIENAFPGLLLHVAALHNAPPFSANVDGDGATCPFGNTVFDSIYVKFFNF
jgi:hypothetical protein